MKNVLTTAITLLALLAVSGGAAQDAGSDAGSTAGQDSTTQPTTQPSSKNASKKNTSKKDARGFIKLGTVRFSKERGEVEVDGYFNMRAGYLEYLACSPNDKVHESLVSLECDPVDLKVGLILLGLEDMKDQDEINDLDPIDGPRVMMFLRWEAPERIAEDSEDTDDSDAEADTKPADTPAAKKKIIKHEKRVEDCVFNALMEESMERCGFVYTGSFEIDTNPPSALDEPDVKREPKMVFAPNVTGEYISMVHNRLCLLSNPLGLPYDQGDYYADPDILPDYDRDNPTSVTLIIRKPRKGEIDYEVRYMKYPPPPEEE